MCYSAAMAGPDKAQTPGDFPPAPPENGAGTSSPAGASLFDPSDQDVTALMGWLPIEAALKADLDAIYRRARDLTKMARSENTRRAYRTAWAQYQAWCDGVGATALPADPGTVALYLSVLSKKVRPSTLKARLAAISVAHRLAGHPLDTGHEAIRLIMRGAAREKGLAPKRQARALHYSALPALVDVFGDTPLDLRNKTLVLLGFAAALRRSEIAALELTALQIDKHGLTLTLPRSKADRHGEGETVFVARHPDTRLCPVVTVEKWVKFRRSIEDIKEPRLFLRANRNHSFRNAGISEQTVNLVIKQAVDTLGFDASRYSGHSLRSGLATSAADAGLDLKAIMSQTRLRSARQAMTYVRDAEKKRDNVTRQLFAASDQP